MATSSSAPFCFHTRSQVPATLSCLFFPLFCFYTFFSVPRMLFPLFGQSNHHNAQPSPPPGYLLQKPVQAGMAPVPTPLHLPWTFPCPSPSGTTRASPIGFRCLQGRPAVLSRLHRETPSCYLGQLRAILVTWIKYSHHSHRFSIWKISQPQVENTWRKTAFTLSVNRSFPPWSLNTT